MQTLSFVVDATIELDPDTLPPHCHVVARQATFGRKPVRLKQTYTAASLVKENLEPQPIQIAPPERSDLKQAIIDAYETGSFVVIFAPYRHGSGTLNQLYQLRRENRLPRSLLVENVSPGIRYTALVELLLRITRQATVSITALERLLPIVYQQVAAYWLLQQQSAASGKRLSGLASRLRRGKQHRLVLPNELGEAYQTMHGDSDTLVKSLALKLIDTHAAQDRSLVIRQQGFDQAAEMLRRRVTELAGTDVSIQRNVLAWSPELANRLNQRYLEAVVSPSSAEVKAMYQRAAQIARRYDAHRRANRRISDYRVRL